MHQKRKTKMNSAMKFLCLSAILTTSSAFVNPLETITYHASLASPLCAVHPGWGASRGVPSKTARESAYACEWEPMTELERRIEDGINYEHIQNRPKRKKSRGDDQRTAIKDGIPTANGVFVGYTFTDEEYGRLRSADPDL